MSLCGCQHTRTTIVDGEKVKIIDNRFIPITNNFYFDLVYDINTKIVYLMDKNNYGGGLSQYQIYKDDAIYGAVYKDNEIIPVPYATIN